MTTAEGVVSGWNPPTFKPQFLKSRLSNKVKHLRLYWPVLANRKSFCLLAVCRNCY